MALSDTDVQKQIKQMMGFIEQEANEKVEEIDAKAEEEFNIEKGRLVQQQRLKIMEFYERKEKQSSNLQNQARLKVLQNQQQLVQNLLAEARGHLSKAAQDQKKYGTLVRDLVIQALFQLMEAQVTIRCRESDVPLVESVLPEAVSEYSKGINKPCNITINKSNYLPANSCGGVELSAREGRIKVNNTLESRLEMISGQMLPELRNQLFGVNKSRRFFD
nr:EOG090X0F8Y [Eulimnadia texana]